jgi:hypothetical protein
LGMKHTPFLDQHLGFHILTSQTGNRSDSQVFTLPLMYTHTNAAVLFTEDSALRGAGMPHPMRKIANGADVVTIFLPLWVNDVSGNCSKQYNPRMNVCALNWNLPGRLLHQQFFVHFVSTSAHASALEQLSEVMDCIQCIFMDI